MSIYRKGNPVPPPSKTTPRGNPAPSPSPVSKRIVAPSPARPVPPKRAK